MSPQERPADVHEIGSTDRVVCDYRRMTSVPGDHDRFLTHLKDRHATIMGIRGEIAGVFQVKIEPRWRHEFRGF